MHLIQFYYSWPAFANNSERNPSVWLIVDSISIECETMDDIFVCLYKRNQALSREEINWLAPCQSVNRNDGQIALVFIDVNIYERLIKFPITNWPLSNETLPNVNPNKAFPSSSSNVLDFYYFRLFYLLIDSITHEQLPTSFFALTHTLRVLHFQFCVKLFNRDSKGILCVSYKIFT